MIILIVVILSLFLLFVLIRYINEKYLLSRSNTKIGDLNADVIMRQYKFDKMANFMEIKSNNPRLKQSENAKLLELSSSTIQRYRRETNMPSPYRLPPSCKTNRTRKKSYQTCTLMMLG